jgi:hypothetical protein
MSSSRLRQVCRKTTWLPLDDALAVEAQQGQAKMGVQILRNNRKFRNEAETFRNIVYSAVANPDRRRPRPVRTTIIFYQLQQPNLINPPFYNSTSLQRLQ